MRIAEILTMAENQRGSLAKDITGEPASLVVVVSLTIDVQLKSAENSVMELISVRKDCRMGLTLVQQPTRVIIHQEHLTQTIIVTQNKQ